MINLETDINRAKIPEVSIVDLDNYFIRFNLEDYYVDVPKESIELYKRSLDKKKSFFHRIGLFLTAQNEAGKVAKSIKDVILTFTPFGNKIEDVTDIISLIIKRAMPQEKKSPTKSKTIVTFGVLFLASLLVHFGIVPAETLEISPDAAWVATATSVVGIILRFVTRQPITN